MFVPLSHRPGHAQADFGEADGYIGGKKVRFHYFCMDLPLVQRQTQNARGARLCGPAAQSPRRQARPTPRCAIPAAFGRRRVRIPPFSTCAADAYRSQRRATAPSICVLGISIKKDPRHDRRCAPVPLCATPPDNEDGRRHNQSDWRGAADDRRRQKRDSRRALKAPHAAPRRDHQVADCASQPQGGRFAAAPPSGRTACPSSADQRNRGAFA